MKKQQQKQKCQMKQASNEQGWKLIQATSNQNRTLLELSDMPTSNTIFSFYFFQVINIQKQKILSTAS